MKGNEIELKSPDVQEILGRPPRKIIRAGITVVFAVVALLFVGSYFIKYPEVLASSITVTTENLPAGVMAKVTGRIDTVFVNEKQHVSNGDILAVLENSACFEDVQMLKLAMDTIDACKSLILGDIQPYYTSFLKAREDYRHFLLTDYHNRKMKVVQKQIAVQKQLVEKSRNKVSNGAEQVEVAHRLYVMDSLLYVMDAQSMSGLQLSRNKYLAQLQDYEASRMDVDNQCVAILQSEQAVFDLQHERVEEETDLIISLNTARNQLLSQIQDWEQTCLLKAPCDGIATFTKYWQKNQNVTAGEILVTVVPEKQQKIVGKILLPPQGAGKVKIGQTVNVKFDGFPYMEYGMVKVQIQDMSLVPISVDGSNRYLLEVAFPRELVTTYGKKLEFTQEMTGTAEIITNDLRLLDRFLNPIRALFNR